MSKILIIKDPNQKNKPITRTIKRGGCCGGRKKFKT
jgi:hypothetical protein